MRMLATVVLGFVLGGSGAIASAQQARTMDQVIDRVITNENRLDQQIRQYSPQVPVLILSIFPEEQYATRVLKAGAAGYINKDAAPTELVKAVQRILQGRKYITPFMAEKMAGDLLANTEKAAHELLSDREFHVMKLLAGGKTISDIAEMLSLSPTTISTYRARIMEKMKMKANAELARYALENRLI